MFREMRRFKQQVSEAECIDILKSTKRGVLSVIGDDGYPYGMPIIIIVKQMESFIFMVPRPDTRLMQSRHVTRQAIVFTMMAFEKKGIGP